MCLRLVQKPSSYKPDIYCRRQQQLSLEKSVQNSDYKTQDQHDEMQSEAHNC